MRPVSCHVTRQAESELRKTGGGTFCCEYPLSSCTQLKSDFIVLMIEEASLNRILVAQSKNMALCFTQSWLINWWIIWLLVAKFLTGKKLQLGFHIQAFWYSINILPLQVFMGLAEDSTSQLC